MKNNPNQRKGWLQDKLAFLRPAVPFLLAVLISASIWVINSLNKTHVTTVRFTLNYNGVTTAPEKAYTRYLTAEISGRGFDLIRFLFEKKTRQITVNALSKSRIPALEKINSHLQTIERSLHVNRVSPNYIDLPQTRLYSKRLKVVPDVHFETLSSYIKTIPAIAVPDSITIYSELPVPDSLTSVKTTRTTATAMKEPWFGSAKILLNDTGQYLPQTEKVWIYQPVEEATEISLSLPVNPGPGIPHNFRFIPASVTLTCMIPLSRYSVTTADKFLVTASVKEEDQERAIVRVITAPPWAEHIRYQPSSVEFLSIRP